MGAQLRNEGDAGVKAMRDIRNSHKGVLKRKRPEALEAPGKAAEAEQEAQAQHDEEEDGQHEDHQDDHRDSDDDMDVAPPQADAGTRAAGACNNFSQVHRREWSWPICVP